MGGTVLLGGRCDRYDRMEDLHASGWHGLSKMLNLLHGPNEELSADFDLDAFRHFAPWESVDSRIEMHLESTCHQTVRVPAPGLELEFNDGETIHTESSYKFTDDTLNGLLSGSGFEIGATWKDTNHWYALTPSRRRD
jgi:L-histidine N-alpha-methyltransferase